jgi:uncharacterized protein (TIGR02217 family)
MFLESPRFPDDLAVFALGGAEFSTDVIVLESGYEQRNQIWSQNRATYTIQQGLRVKDVTSNVSYQSFYYFYNTVQGRLNGFRFKDFQDWNATNLEGILGTGTGNGYPTYQLSKNYTTGSSTYTRIIRKPVVSTEQIYRNNTLLTNGSNPGNYSIDYTTGIVTFVPDYTYTITSITSGVNPTITTSIATNIQVGQYVYINNTNSTTGLNNKAFLVTSVPTSTTFIISATNLDTSNSTGNAYLYPQSTDTLTASFEFDVPCRFDTEDIKAGMEQNGGLIQIQTINLVEIRV